MMNSSTFPCIRCRDYYCSPKRTCSGASYCFASYHLDSSGIENYSKGCIDKEQQALLICSSSFSNGNEGLVIQCCRGDFCNDIDYPSLPSSGLRTFPVWALVSSIVLGCLLVIVAALVIFYVLSTKSERCKKYWNKYFNWFNFKRSNFKSRGNYHTTHKERKLDDSTERMLTDSLSSGSGSGSPFNFERTLAKNIRLQNIIGQGRYGIVWKGIYQGEPVAVKIFSTRDEGSWERETEVYSTVCLRHEGILAYYGSDKTCVGSSVQLWLVTHYHPYGSLHQYLKSRILDHGELYPLCLSFINGLLHLHTEIMGSQGKPPIAHRDINSNNILVKNDGTCCISDMGLAVMGTSISGEINVGNSDRTGTIRYMSPEVLDGSLNTELFGNFVRADIYSAALVIWEMAVRCNNEIVEETHSRPFGHILPEEPNFHQMHNIVCVKQMRPCIPSFWSTDKTLSSIEKILSESWHQNPRIRLTTMRIKKNLIKSFEKGMELFN